MTVAFPSQTSADESDTAHLRDGRNITLEEVALHLSGAAVLLRQVAYALETPATAVETADEIDSLRRTATDLADRSTTFMRLAKVVDGDAKVAARFPNGDPWGVAARQSDRTDFGGPAVIPTVKQLLWLADIAGQVERDQAESGGVRSALAYLAIGTTTYPDAMTGINHGMWESKAAQARRQRERDAEVALELLRIACTRCDVGEGQHCRTSTGRIAETPHKSRQAEAESNVDARLGFLGDNPLGVADDA